jgi:hypothetical protein
MRKFYIINLFLQVIFIIILIVSCKYNKNISENTIVNKFTDDNSNEISEDFKRLIENKEIKPLSLLETIDKKKYDIIIGQLPEDEFVKNYFYEVDGENYEIWYYEIFFEKYSGWLGDPTGKCFTIIFNNKNEIVDKYKWR